MARQPFRFKHFHVDLDDTVYPISTDSVLLGAWANVDHASHVLDIGAGTGVIALMVAQRTKAGVLIWGVDLQPASSRCARRNFEASPWAGRLSSIEAPVQQLARQKPEFFDLIVSNPPFYSETVVSPDTHRRNSRSTVTLSPSDLLSSVNGLMRKSGKFCTILPVQEGRRLVEEGVCAGLYCTSETVVYARRNKPAERLLLQFERDPRQFRRSELSIYDQNGHYSSEFRHLTHEFYL